MKTTYLAITIGPIYKTIQSAQKTRELWAASFFLSQYMKTILEKLEKEKYGICLSPDVSELNSKQTYHGAGIWNDNCFYRLHEERVEALKAGLPDLLRAAKMDMIAKIALEGGKRPLPLNLAQMGELFDQHFACSAVLHTRTEGKAVLLELGELLASAELLDTAPPQYDDYVGEALFRPKTVLGLYHAGFAGNYKVFTQGEADGKWFRRMPSLLEIATRQFMGHADYKQVVKAISEKAGKAAGKEKVTDLEQAEEIELALEEGAGQPAEEGAILDILKATGDFKKHHKYVAIVQSDGDGISNIIRKFADEAEGEMKDFSQQLMAFSKVAVQEIADYDGLPVYAGGDDLLFFAPLQNQYGDNIFDLLAKIRKAFAEQPMLQAAGSSMSFGISIFYYKYPLGEALEEGRKQLFRIAKKLGYSTAPLGEKGSPSTKNACAFRVLLHGGQAFGAVLQQEGAAWDAWQILFGKQEIEEAQGSLATEPVRETEQPKPNLPGDKDAAFLSGLVHRLERLEYLLEEACTHGQGEHFFKQHFNEATEFQRGFIKKVRALAEAIYAQYGLLHIAWEDAGEFFAEQMPLSEQERIWLADKKQYLDHATLFRRRYCSNLLYSALRMIQFLKANDHE